MGTFIGIDPGKSGGISCLRNGELVFCKLCPKTEEEMVRILDEILYLKPTVYIESVSARPGQGVVSMFSFGKGFGIWIGICKTLGYKIEFVQPQKWKKHFSLIKQDKKASIKKAKELFPDVNLKPGRLRTEHHGMAESILIAKYGFDQLRKEGHGTLIGNEGGGQ